MLNASLLVTLEAVLARGSFAAAAAELGYTPSAVSQQISQLERETGLVLFERFPRSIRPTPAAHYINDSGAGILSGLRALGRDAKSLASATLGAIRVGCFQTASAQLLPDVLNNFQTRHPAVTVHLDEAEPAELVPALLDGDLDLAIVYENDLDPQQWPDRLVRRDLLTEQRLLLLPPGFREIKTAVRLSDLRREVWVATKPSPSLHRLCAREGFEPHVTLRSNDYYSVCAFVRAGLGIALVPELGFFLRDDLTYRQLQPTAPQRHVFTLHRDTNRNPLLTPMLKTLKQVADDFAHDHGAASQSQPP